MGQLRNELEEVGDIGIVGKRRQVAFRKTLLEAIRNRARGRALRLKMSLGAILVSSMNFGGSWPHAH